jgi:transposase-like protein
LLGPNAPGLSATTVTRLITTWQKDYETWNTRSLEGQRYAYVWADGVHFNIRLEEDRQCILVLMGATPEGKKELIAVVDGYRESEQSWHQLLLDGRQRGLIVDPKLAVGDGALGFWKAVRQIYPATREQRCWVHKTANVLDKMPKRIQPAAKGKIHQMYLSATKREALEALDDFLELYQDKFPKACQCLVKDKEVLFTFYDFPAAHWLHLRTTNPIESTFATVRHRTRQTKGCGSRAATLSMVYKLGREAEKKWRRLNGSELVIKVMTGIRFVDGIEENRESIAA